MSKHNVNFLLLFSHLQSIIEYLTFEAFCYTSRGLYEVDKMTFTILLTLKIQLSMQTITHSEFSVFIKGMSYSVCCFGWSQARQMGHFYFLMTKSAIFTYLFPQIIVSKLVTTYFTGFRVKIAFAVGIRCFFVCFVLL